MKLTNKVPDYWQTYTNDSSNNCTFYFEEYILTEINSDIVLALDNIDRLFVCQETTVSFLSLLCSWHEKGKTDHYWSKLKLILAHSTNTSIALDSSRSPLNAGVPILLKEFDRQQVKILANLYQLNWDEFEISRLMNEVGGHPYLVRLAMYQIKTQNTLKQHF